MSIIVNILAIFGLFIIIVLIGIFITVVIIAIRAKRIINKSLEDPEYAETVKQKLARYHAEKHLAKGGCCGENKDIEDVSKMFFKGKHKRPDNDNSTSSS